MLQEIGVILTMAMAGSNCLEGTALFTISGFAIISDITAMAQTAHHFFMYHVLFGKRSKQAVTSMAYLFGIAGNVVVVPQIIQAWSSKAPGLSVTTWILFVCSGLFWLVYAIQQRQKPLIFGYLVCILVDSAVVAGWCFNNLIR